MITGKELVEKMYSENNEVQEEKLYSTGNDELDEMLEKAFCEGYELGQREFGNPQNKAAERRRIMKEGYKSLVRSGELNKVSNNAKDATELGNTLVKHGRLINKLDNSFNFIPGDTSVNANAFRRSKGLDKSVPYENRGLIKYLYNTKYRKTK